MCGICGSFAYGSLDKPDVVALRAMRDAMSARGPDSRGEWESQDESVWFGHRRLAIIDLTDHGRQPMLSADGRIAITFNGEIYNHAELRRELEAKGHIFRTSSDTEVIIELYRAMGPSFVSRLRGMFAFALWSADQNELLLARDPYGIKPLYFSDRDGTITFASSVKALINAPRLPKTPDARGLIGFYLFGSVPEPWTLYESVRAVPAGSTIRITANGVEPSRCYFSIVDALAKAERIAQRRPVEQIAAHEIMRAALLDSVRAHLVSDVPVGAFLSAGVDSSALVGLMRDAGKESIRTVTLAYDEFAGAPSNEAPLAETVAKYYGTEHVTRRVSAAEFEQDFPKILLAMDQPSVDGINTWFVSKASRELGLKVAISGVGGDELLGGYSTFNSVPRLARLMSAPARLPGLARLAHSAVHLAKGAGLPVHPKYAGLLRYGGSIPGAYFLQRGLFLPEDLHEAIADREFVRSGLEGLAPLEVLSRTIAGGPSTSFGQIAALESTIYLRNQLLRDADWASMAHSLELRTPLVDHCLLQAVAPVMFTAKRPSGKALLAAAPSRPVPDAILNRPKTGFAIPVEKWIGEMQTDALHPSSMAQPFSRRWARSIASRH